MADSFVCFVGPLPPPVHGFSEINLRMLQALQKGHPVVVFDMAPRANPLCFLTLWWRFLLCLLRRRPSALYLALSGGHRQWIDLAFVLVACLRGVPIFVHHHTFSYLSARRFSSTVFFRVVRKATHIVLCVAMGDQLARTYGIESVNVRVVSNASFLEEIDGPVIDGSVQADSGEASLRVGFLSNITAEKGIFEYLATLHKSAALGLRLQGVIAGPVDPGIQGRFSATLAATGNARYMGAVYGAAKTEFFSQIDVLFFPSQLQEGEPVTILEALGNGVPVIAFSSGCIAGMIPAAAGAVIPYSPAFVQEAVRSLRPLAESAAHLVKAREAARATFQAMRASSKTVLDRLVTEMK